MKILKGIIFDFDGLICDTETPEIRAWEAIYTEFGLSFPIDTYYETIGAIHNDDTPFRILESKLDYAIDRQQIQENFVCLRDSLIENEGLLPGIFDFLQYAKNNGLAICLASSSPYSWIEYHLKRLLILDYFDCILTRDDVKRTKPDPELFIKSLSCMNLKSNEVIALEDSINGVRAAKEAGLFVVAVPNEATRNFDFSEADLVVDSLINLSFPYLKNTFINR